MAKNQFTKSLDWDAFRSLGNSESDDTDTDEQVDEVSESLNLKDAVRVYLERKGRGGKTVSIIKGLTSSEEYLMTLCKSLKAKCGVGGKVEGGEIIIQGDQRKRLISELNIMGFSNVKNAGA